MNARPPTPSPGRVQRLPRRADWQVVWFKRDLRLADHSPLTEALRQG
ncbi:MAG: deoxyribodipyrimidine photo-lyase, partial [Verrucomicrobia bacterium]|nr:deoxyribodipyrimidine photo-lyase [Verrucomicrobiota bacterium]